MGEAVEHCAGQNGFVIDGQCLGAHTTYQYYNCTRLKQECTYGEILGQTGVLVALQIMKLSFQYWLITHLVNPTSWLYFKHWC